MSDSAVVVESDAENELDPLPTRKYLRWGAFLAAPSLYAGTMAWAAAASYDGFLYMLGFAALGLITFLYVYSIGLTADMRRRRALRSS